jgi:gliding motility-associated-like protein
MKKILLFLFTILLHTGALGFHIAGGDLTCKWISGNNFEVTLTLFRDCSNPNGADFDQEITLGIFHQDDNTLFDTLHLSLNSFSPLSYSGPGCVAPPQVCMQEGFYKKIVQLPNYPGGYYFVWERCCRNSTLVNIDLPDEVGMAFYATIPDPAIRNSSPVFTSPPLPYVCVGALFRIPFTAFDADGDSLSYAFTQPLAGGNTNNQAPNPFNPTGANEIPIAGPYAPIIWGNGYSLSDICGGPTPLVIDPITGLSEGTTDNIGMFAMAVTVYEYRNGVLIGTTRREIEITSIPCIGNDAPLLSSNVKNVNYEIFATDSLILNITANDPNGDTINLVHKGEIFANSSLLSIQPPYANTYDTSGIGNLNTTFSWFTDCNQSRSTPYVVTYEITDNGCPLPLTSVGKIYILVKPTPLVSRQNIQCLEKVSNDVIRIHKAPDSKINPKYFKYFTLYRSIDGGSFQAYKTFNDPTEILFYDSIATNNTSIDYCYQISGTNTCNIEGDLSDTVCSITNKQDQNNKINLVTVDNKNSIRIKWDDYPDGAYSTYFIERRENKADAIFETITELTNYSMYEWIDNFAETDKKSYCYRLSNKNFCGETGPLSDESCSILLEGSSEPFKHNLFWNKYINYTGNTLGYKIERSSKNEGIPLLDRLNAGPLDSISVDDDLPLAGGFFGYRVRATSLSTNGESYSNIIELFQDPILLLPNAFTPNQDGNNDVWGGPMAFVKEFSLVLFNRWGQKVFETNSPFQMWDGSFQGNPSPQGVYFYKFKYIGFTSNIPVEKTGTVTLIR